MKKFFYRVQKGESILAIANKFNGLVGKIICDNNLKKEIEEGDVILIESYENLYEFMPTDTLSSISKKFGVNKQEILDKNHLPYLFFGLKILI